MTKTNILQDEWDSLVRAPFDVALGVAAIGAESLAGAAETPVELAAGMKEIVALARQFPRSEIVQDVVRDIDDKLIQTQARRNIAECSLDTLLQTCQQVAEILDHVAPREAKEFKQYLLLVADKVAHAAGGVGGFQGFGKKRVSTVSDQESAALKQIAAALRIQLR